MLAVSKSLVSKSILMYRRIHLYSMIEKDSFRISNRLILGLVILSESTIISFRIPSSQV